VRILYLGSGRSIHVIRWVRAIAARGHDVYFATQAKLREPIPECAGVEILPNSGVLGYLFNVRAFRRLTERLRPDVIHVHYATGYGMLARLAAGSAPIVLTVYGSDVLDFPHLGRWHRALLIKNLRSARVITSASRAMADAIRELLPAAKIFVVPFGVDTSKFRPILQASSADALIVGTVKGLDPVYGVDLLLRAFSLLPRRGTQPLKLVIGGCGPAMSDLRALSEKLGIARDVTFLGDVPHDEVPRVLGTFTVYAALSRRESFGVAVAEASACGIPIVATRVGGLPEVVLDGVTGLLVPPEDARAAADAIARLLADSQARSAMGMAGRDFVRKTYKWDLCVDAMLEVYRVACEPAARSRQELPGVSATRSRVSIDA
jgi:glycosyltransferase involved in cell wall biosynthesis